MCMSLFYSEESETITGWPDPEAYQQSNTSTPRSSGSSGTREGRWPFSAQCSVPWCGGRNWGFQSWKTGRGAAGKEHGLLCCHLLRVSEGAGSSGTGACSGHALPTQPGHWGVTDTVPNLPTVFKGIRNQVCKDRCNYLFIKNFF